VAAPAGETASARERLAVRGEGVVERLPSRPPTIRFKMKMALLNLTICGSAAQTWQTAQR